MTIRLEHLAPAAEEGWWTLFELASEDSECWMVIGGQMMQLHAAENGVTERVRPTDDLDVVVNVRTRPRGTEWLSKWLMQRGFELEGINSEGVGHRFTRVASGGLGSTVFDVLAPEGLGTRADTHTVRPARTVGAPGTAQAFGRSELVEVVVSGNENRVGYVRRPNLLGAVIAKAASTSIPVRENPERDWQDSALLLSIIPDPLVAAEACDKNDRKRLRLLHPLQNPDHIGWAVLGADASRQGRAALEFLLE